MITYSLLFLCRDRIMPPKQMSQAAFAKLVADEVAKALVADHATRNIMGARGSAKLEVQIESTFGISECTKRNKVKFAATTLQGRALTGEAPKSPPSGGVATGANTKPIKACYKYRDPNHLANSDLYPERKKQGDRNASGHAYDVKDAEQAQGPNVFTTTSITTHLLKILNHFYFIIIQSFIMTTPFITLTTDSQMYNNIIAAGSRDRPPMLATRRYAQWRSRFLRYIDTRPNGDALKKCILDGPYIPATIVVPAIPEMWEAIERYNKVNPSTFKINNLTVAMMQVNVQFLQQLQPEWSRFVMIVKQQHKLDAVSYHKLFDILKHYQKEVNELRAERIARNANPLALVATAQPIQDPYYQTPKSYKPFAPTSKTSIPTRSHATTRNKGKEIAKPITPPFESSSEEDSDLEQAQKGKDMQKNLALIANYFKKIYKPTNNNLRTSSNYRNKNVGTTPWYMNDNQSAQFRNQRTMTVTTARENIGSLVVQKTGYNTNEEIDEQELEAHYNYMAKIQEVPTADSGTDFELLE
nr:hypothetical protein [Tanacetum cinerariifolium]